MEIFFPIILNYIIWRDHHWPLVYRKWATLDMGRIARIIWLRLDVSHTVGLFKLQTGALNTVIGVVTVHYIILGFHWSGGHLANDFCRNYLQGRRGRRRFFVYWEHVRHTLSKYHEKVDAYFIGDLDDLLHIDVGILSRFKISCNWFQN